MDCVCPGTLGDEGRSARRRAWVRASGRGLAALALVAALLAPPAAHAESAGREFGIGATCALGNLIYGPAKLLYAAGGALVAGAAYAFSGGDVDVAGPILDASVRGDYVLLPDHLRGRRDLVFVGRNPEHERLLRAADGPSARGPDVGAAGPESEVLSEGF